MAPNSFDLRPEIIAIYELIRQHNLAIASLKRERNAHTDVNKLPAELLVHIFSYSQPSYLDIQKDRKYFLRHYVNVSHVCSYWRDLAIFSPSLWSHFDLVPRRWMKEMLARLGSGSTPLSVSLDFSHNQDYEAVAQLLSCMDRMQVLRLHNICLRNPFNLRQFLRLPAPILERLEIMASSEYAFNVIDLSESLSLFSGGTPCLRNVKLHNCSFSWRTLGPAFRDLHELEITSTYDPRRLEPTPDPSDVFYALSQMVRLRRLVLIRAFLLGWNQMPIPNKLINLAQLSELRLEDTFDSLVLFAQKIRSPLQKCNLVCTSDGDNIYSLDAIQDLIVFTITPYASGVIRPLSLYVSNNGVKINDTIFASSSSMELPRETNCASDSIYLSNCDAYLLLPHMSTSVVERTLELFLRQIPTSHLCSLHLAHVAASYQLLLDTVASSPLTHISFSGTKLDGLLSTLGDRSPRAIVASNVGDQSNTTWDEQHELCQRTDAICWPKLSILDLADVDFGLSQTNSYLEQIYDVLFYRMEFGFAPKLGALTITNSRNIERGQVFALRPFAYHFLWDGDGEIEHSTRRRERYWWG
jgi:hypothetical protein